MSLDTLASIAALSLALAGAALSPIVVFGAIGGLCPLLRANRSRPGPSRHDIAG